MARISSNGLTLEVVSDGVGGEPLLLNMGIGSPLVWWNEGFVAELVDRGFHVIRYDHRDVGLSERLPHLGVPSIVPAIPRAFLNLPVAAPYTLWDLADDAVGILDALGLESAHLGGVSMGGMVAQCAALRYPERVRSLSLIMTTSGERWSSLGRPRAIAALVGKAPVTVEEAEETLLRATRVIGGSGFPLEEERVRRNARMSWERGLNPDGFRRHFAAVLAQEDRTPLLRGLDLPVTVMHGAADPLIPPSAGKHLAANIPGARLELFDGMGHFLPQPLFGELADLVARTAEAGGNRFRSAG